jgi:hypothetical protein
MLEVAFATAARNASTTRRCCRKSRSELGALPDDDAPGWASWRAATGERSTIGAISSNVMPKTSWSTKASRSAGSSVSSTMRSARPTESASMASDSGSHAPRVMIGSGRRTSSESSRRDVRARSISRHTRATTVVSQRRRLATSSTSARLNRIQVSWTASSASLADPSMRCAIVRRCARCSSNSPASHSLVAISHRVPVNVPIAMTDRTSEM